MVFMKTQRDIAKAAGVSLKTVSRVLNDDPLVRPETRARVEQVFRKMGYQPNVAAKIMRAKKSNIIGFIADGVAMSNSSIDLIRGAQDVAWSLGKQMMLFNILAGREDGARAEDQLAQFRAEAVIYATVYHRLLTNPPRAERSVLLNCFSAQPNIPTILPDDYGLARLLMREVFAKGYRRPFFFNLSEDHCAAGLRRRGYIDEGREHGLDLAHRVRPAVIFRDGRHFTIVDDLLRDVLSEGEKPDIIICAQDILAMELYFAIAAAGFIVGQDFGVASFDNQDPVPERLRPKLSTVQLPYYEMGRAAMELACGVSPAQPTVQLVPGRFIGRESF